MISDVELLEKKSAVISKYGPWTGHNIHLQNGIYTIRPEIVGDEIRLRRIVQCVLDHTGSTGRGLRVLDLACGEGLFGIEFARLGADCLLMEGREPHLAKIRFVKEVLALDTLEVALDDVRNLSVEKYGKFDVVLCLGILYHLQAPDVFQFAERLFDVCKGICVVGTRVSLRPKTQFNYKEHTYRGTWVQGFLPGDSREFKMSRLWASLDHDWKVYLSRPSIYNLLSNVGFSSVYECQIPAEPKKPGDRVTFVALKSDCREIIGAPLLVSRCQDEMPEHPVREHGRLFMFVRAIGRMIPPKYRRILKRMVGLDNPHGGL